MKYPYEDLSYKQFEDLVEILCQKLFGVAVQGFAEGPDGGRDAKFVGTADHFPSQLEPWKGTTIFQAKHTSGYNRSFSEGDFYSTSSKSTVIANEIPRIKKLRENKQIDNYMLFANRRLTGTAENDIRAHIAKECAIPEASIFLCGVEKLEIWMKTYPDVPKIAGIDPIDMPLNVNSEDLAEIVEALARHKKDVSQMIDDPPTPRVSYTQKNALNKMTDDYAKVLRKRYLKDTTQIQIFLAAPENLALMHMYESVVEEYQLKIISKRKDYQSFDEIMTYLMELLLNRDPVLRQHPHKRLMRAMLFYMYWNCDIGKVDDDKTDETLTP